MAVVNEVACGHIYFMSQEMDFKEIILTLQFFHVQLKTRHVKLEAMLLLHWPDAYLELKIRAYLNLELGI